MGASFTTLRPQASGWYEVIWEPGDTPVKVYLHVSLEDDYICWGWDESDDPEAIELDIAQPELIQFRKLD